MRIILTNHAQKRMFERDIKIRDIQNTIGMPNYTILRVEKSSHIEK